jgi:hypothetical protein
LCGCKTWSLTLRGENRPRVFENKRILRPTREEKIRWRKSHNEKLHYLHSSPNKIRIIKLRRLRGQGK